MNYRDKDELAEKYGTDLPDDVSNEQAAFALKNFNYLKYLMMGAQNNETVRNNKRA